MDTFGGLVFFFFFFFVGIEAFRASLRKFL